MCIRDRFNCQDAFILCEESENQIRSPPIKFVTLHFLLCTYVCAYLNPKTWKSCQCKLSPTQPTILENGLRVYKIDLLCIEGNKGRLAGWPNWIQSQASHSLSLLFIRHLKSASGAGYDRTVCASAVDLLLSSRPFRVLRTGRRAYNNCVGCVRTWILPAEHIDC